MSSSPHASLDLYAGQGLRLGEAARVATAAESAGSGACGRWKAHTEPFRPLALAAEHTSRIRLGTAVAVALARNPMVVAHLAHELNQFAAGRFSLGQAAASHGSGGRAGDWDAMTDLIPGDLLREFSVEALAGSLAGALHERFDGVLDRIMVYAPYPVAGGLWREAGLGSAAPESGG